MSKIENPPAFPSAELNADGAHYYSHFGMTLRDYYAGQALPSVVSFCLSDSYEKNDPQGAAPQHIAALCYLYADAMLAERAKRGNAR